jgi:hypothetical protein
LIEPGNFDKPVQRRYWEDWFDITGGPCARAYHLLKKSISGLSAIRAADRTSSSMRGPIPATAPIMSTRRNVNAKDMLSLSFLEVRLIDLKLPIKIVEGD